MEEQNKKFKSFFNNNTPKDMVLIKQRLDLIEKRIKLLETENKKLKDEHKKLMGNN